MSVLAVDPARLPAVEEARLAATEAEILKLHNSILELRQPLDSYTYPVLTLPNEIVSEIFMHFLPV
jgi:hypothetical protein